jgi:hypothetical protein
MLDETSGFPFPRLRLNRMSVLRCSHRRQVIDNALLHLFKAFLPR